MRKISLGILRGGPSKKMRNKQLQKADKKVSGRISNSEGKHARKGFRLFKKGKRISDTAIKVGAVLGSMGGLPA